MKPQRLSPPTAARLRYPGWGLALLLLPVSAGAATHLVDFMPCKGSVPGCNVMEPCVEISATVGVPINDTIAATDHGGVPVAWSFDVEPPQPPCTGVAPVFTCHGITIDASGDPVTVTGTPTAKDSISFGLEGDNGTDLCYEGFELIIAQPFDLVLVLDRSGSMNWTTHISPPATDRWDALKRAVDGFAGIVETSSCAAGSRVGMTLFATNPIPNGSFTNTLGPVTASLDTDIANELAQTPLGATALGKGLQNGIGKFDDATRSRLVLLFSDGEQNQDPKVDHTTGLTYVGGGNVAPGGAGAFKVVTVGIGNPMGIYHDAMQRLATSHGGSYHVTQTGEDLAAALDTATADLLEGCSPQMVASYSGDLAEPVTLPAFDVNGKVGQLLIRFSLDRDFEVPTLGQLAALVRIRRDGSDVTRFFQPSISGNFTNTLLLRTDFTDPEGGATIEPHGSYEIRLNPTPVFEDLGFRAVVYADDERLSLDPRVTTASPRAQQPFEVRMDLSWLGRPVTDATVQATILKPGDDLGDALARNPLTVDPTSGPDAGSPGEQKFVELLQDDGFVAGLLPEEQQLTLVHRGDGVYTASYNPGDVAGVYQVLYRVRADEPFGKVQRLARRSVYVRPGAIDLNASRVSTTVGNGVVTIGFRPITTYGRFIGPAQGSGITVDGAGISLTEVTDHQDGSYTLELTGDPDAEIKVDVLGDEIYSGPASTFGPRGPGGPARLGWSLHVGLPDPRSGFAPAIDGDLLVEGDLEYRLSDRLSLDLVLGRYSFDPEIDIDGATLYLRGYLPMSSFRLFAEGGLGLYDSDELDLDWGWSVGVGADRPLGGGLRGEIGVDFFHLDETTADVEFLAYKVGIRRSF